LEELKNDDTQNENMGENTSKQWDYYNESALTQSDNYDGMAQPQQNHHGEVPQPEKKRWSDMKKASLFFFLVLILEIPMSFLVYGVQLAIPAKYSTLASILITQGYLLLSAVIYLLVTKTKFTRDLHFQKYRVSTFFLSIVLLITASPMASWLNVLSQFFASNSTSTAIFQVTETVPMWLGILIIGCLPGLVEETLYRGIIFSAFRQRSVLTGIVVSALSFGLMHMNFNQILYAIYLGVIFALVVEATGSLASTMILHALFNGMNTIYIYVLPKLYEFLGHFYAEYANMNLEDVLNEQPTKMQLLSSLVALTPFAVGGLVLTVLLLKAIAKMNGRTLTWASVRGDQSKAKQISPVNVFLILGWIFCLLMAVGELFE
jgi:hypothetical protein